MWKRIRNYLVTGLFLVLPAFITGYLVWLVFNFTDNLLGSIFHRWAGRRIPGLGVAAFLLLLILVGIFGANYLGKRVIRRVERWLARIPLVGGIYGTTRQFAEALSSPEKGVFRRVVRVEFPRAGLYSLGFLTGEAPASINPDGTRLLNVFIPKVPNPTTGFLIHVPEESLTYLPMSVDEGLRMIISAGVVKPRSAPQEEDGK